MIKATDERNWNLELGMEIRAKGKYEVLGEKGKGKQLK